MFLPIAAGKYSSGYLTAAGHCYKDTGKPLGNAHRLLVVVVVKLCIGISVRDTSLYHTRQLISHYVHFNIQHPLAY
jgi:hypothetical protein